MRSGRLHVKIVALAIAILYASLVVYDLASPYTIRFSEAGCNSSVLVIDAYNEIRGLHTNYCVLRSLSLNQLRSLGALDSKVIFLATHLYSSSRGFALGTSDKSVFLDVILHPITSILGLSAGVLSNGSRYVALEPRAFYLTPSLNGKVIVLVTCNCRGALAFAKVFIKHGASIVICVCKKEMLYSWAYEFLKQLLKAYEHGGLKALVAMSREWGFKVVFNQRLSSQKP